MRAGKILAIISGILGISSILLYYFAPQIFSFWRFNSGVVDEFLGGFGTGYGTLLGAIGIHLYEDIFLLFVGLLVLVGGELTLIGGVSEIKIIIILGGTFMITGIALFFMILLFGLGDFKEIAAFLPSGENLFFGRIGGADWGVWISFYLAMSGGILGIIGGVILEE
jgi:hypothetical protein